MNIFLQATFEGLSLGAVYSLVAIGFVLIFRATDVLSFAQPAMVVVGAAVSYTHLTLPTILLV